MNSRRAIILIVALVVGTLAAGALYNYTRSLEDSAYADQQTAEVWVVTQTIPKGTSAERAINERFIAVQEVPVGLRPATAIVDPDTELFGLVAITDLPPNATLVTGLFVSPAVVSTGVTDRLEEKGLVTLTFNVDQVHGAAFLIEPGDFVNVLTVSPLEEEEAKDGEDEAIIVTPEGTDRSGIIVYEDDARYLFQKAEVLAIDRNLPADLGAPAPAADGEAAVAAAPANQGLITLAVPPEAVQEFLSIGLSTIYLSLVPPTYEPAPLEPIDLGREVLPGEDPLELTPYGPDQAPIQ